MGFFRLLRIFLYFFRQGVVFVRVQMCESPSSNSHTCAESLVGHHVYVCQWYPTLPKGVTEPLGMSHFVLLSCRQSVFQVSGCRKRRLLHLGVSRWLAQGPNLRLYAFPVPYDRRHDVTVHELYWACKFSSNDFHSYGNNPCHCYYPHQR